MKHSYDLEFLAAVAAAAAVELAREVIGRAGYTVLEQTSRLTDRRRTRFANITADRDEAS